MSGATMNALVLHAVGDVRLEKIALPEPAAGHVRVRVGFCGVCGSDIPRVFIKGTYRFPTVCGHEFAGSVEALGEGVDDLEPGDPVAVFPLIWCGQCPACEQGHYVQCHDYDYLGSRRDGAFAEYVVAPRRNLLRVPDGVSLEEAAMTEPASVALHALRRGGGSMPGETVAVFGAGPIGLMVAQWARAMGASHVLLFDIVPGKLELARSLGFSEAHDSRHEAPLERILALTGGAGAHLTVEAAGVPQTLLEAAGAARRGGRVVLLGNPSGEVTLSAPLISQLLRREVSLHGTWNSDFSPAGNDDDWHTTLEAMRTRAIDLRPLVTHRVSLDRSLETLEMMRDGREFYSKVLIQP
ncbi:MAG: galactitol-1-phosphate 5-dehydrogenase [Planctomycetota bacterium]|nr:galactitol-1-phosphate 5-dehydrogenase [Planctomycetota bacterium]